MKKISLLTVILVMFVMLNAQSVAVIAGMKGKISIIRDNKYLTAKSGDVLKNADEIQSGEESYAAIRFADNGATTKLFPNSTMVINASIDGKIMNKRNSISKGTAHSKVTPKSGNYIIETPNTVASVKGTDFITTYENNITTVGVIEGEVEVKSKNSDKTQDAKANDVYQVDDDGNVDELEDSNYIEQNTEDENQDQQGNQGEQGDQGQNEGSQQGSGSTGTDYSQQPGGPQEKVLEIEIQKPDGIKKKVRIRYE